MRPIEFTPSHDEFIDIETMSTEELRAFQEEMYTLLVELDAREPKNMNSPAYDDWADEHEELEDLLDDIQDRLDMLIGT